MYDITVIGAGPAGLCAALYARRAGKSVLILERGAFGGQITYSPRVENYPAFESISGNELAERMVSQVLAQGAEVELENVTEIVDGEKKKVLTEDGSCYECRAVIIAAGVRHRYLGLENEEKFIGEGISFCAVCDGAFYAGRDVVLVGGGNSALQEAILLSEACRKVTVVQNLEHFTGERRLYDILAARENVELITSSTVCEIHGGDTFEGITVKNSESGEERRIDADGMFLAVGLEPENGLFASLCALDENGYIDSDESCTTRTAGIFAAGDCRRKGVRQVSTAIADGATAALAACRYIDAL